MLQRLLDPFRGKAITIPPMDGPLRPDNALDEARLAASAPEPDNLVLSGGRVLFSSAGAVFALAGPGRPPEPIAQFDAPVTALAAGPDGALAAGLDDGRIFLRGGGHDGKVFDAIGPNRLACPTALAFAGADALLVCQGSSRVRPSEWVVDLMSRNRAGSVWRLDLGSSAETLLAGDLAFPFGVALAGSRIIVAESWSHRLVALAAAGGGRPEPVLDKLPGYPSRLAAALDGGFWLALFAPRNRLVEFVLDEDDYRTEMIRDIERSLWIAPALAARRSFREPLQCGGVRTMGVFKPWSPTLSYGLLVKLNADFKPVASFHSRASGIRHGITSAVEHDGEVFASSRGGDAILALPAPAPAG